jgi:hypothetical protein
VSGKPCEAFLLVVVLVPVLGFSAFLDYEHEDDDENGPSPTFSKHPLTGDAVVARYCRDAVEYFMVALPAELRAG